MNDSWKEQFPNWILERGRTYHQMGRVQRLTHHGREVSAVVEGTENYHVAVRFSTGMPEAASCTCPYAAQGSLCKHMAALLYELETLDYTPDDQGFAPGWEDAVQELSPESLRIVLRNLAEQDPKLQELLLRLYRYQEMISPEDAFHS